MSNNFAPIAIIGQACVFPESYSPEALWNLSINKRDCLTTFSHDYLLNIHENVAWPISKVKNNIFQSSNLNIERLRGGCLPDFYSIFNPEGFAIPAEEIKGLDLLFHLALHTARQALISSHHNLEQMQSLRAGAIFGNLSYPSQLFSEFAELTWLHAQGSDYFDQASLQKIQEARPDARNAYLSGFPAHLLAKALKLTQPAYTIDAACASTLYAIKLACDQLQRHHADLMLTGAINAVEHRYLHTGFAALQALSLTGQSRPFHQDADGLVPSIGAGFLVLKRLEDAVKQNDKILGIIRAVALNNDGKQGGTLMPDQAQQVKVMQDAYLMSGLQPQDIDYIECHATGTPHGDKIELASIETVFEAATHLPIAALKSNLGHLLSASGAAATIRAMMALNQGIFPPTVYTDASIIRNNQLRLLNKPEPWVKSSFASDQIRRVAINCFGFGGNNAHLLIESSLNAESLLLNAKKKIFSSIPIPGKQVQSKQATQFIDDSSSEDIAIVGIGVYAGRCQDLTSFKETILQGISALKTHENGSQEGLLETVILAADEIHIPPADLKAAFGEQLTLLSLTSNTLKTLNQPPNFEKTSVFAGMQCHPDVCRLSFRANIKSFLDSLKTVNGQAFPTSDVEWMENIQDEIGSSFSAKDALGCMPNVVANRINQQFDFRGQSFSVSSEELSGIDALTIACNALRQNEIETAIVGAADMCCEDVRRVAAKALLPLAHQIPGDAAVILILQRLNTAQQYGEKIYALLPDDQSDSAHIDTQITWGNVEVEGCYDLTHLIGYPHCAVGLLHVAGAALSAYHTQLPGWQVKLPVPWLKGKKGDRQAKIVIGALGDRCQTLYLRAPKSEDLRLDNVLSEQKKEN